MSLRKILILSLAFISLASAKEMDVLYLTWTDDPLTTMTIHWHTEAGEKMPLTYRERGKSSWQKAAVSQKRLPTLPIDVHTTHLKNLTPGATYLFQISDATYRFKMPQESAFRFLIGGDLYGFLSSFKEMNAVAKKQNPDFVVLGGDIAYTEKIPHPFTTKLTATKRWICFLEHWKKQMVTKDGCLIPFVLTLGNHDVLKKSPELFFALFDFPQKSVYRTLDFGDTLSLFLLDSGYLDDVSGPQRDWLERALIEREKTAFKLPVYHEAAYPSVRSFNHPKSEEIRKHWSPLFEKYGVQAAFEHDNHAYKRTHPITAEEIDPDGPLYLGDGCWGVLPRKTKKSALFAKTARVHHFFQIDIVNKTCDVKAIARDGKVFDEISLCVLPDAGKKTALKTSSESSVQGGLSDEQAQESAGSD